jgi:hypothetical protein
MRNLVVLLVNQPVLNRGGRRAGDDGLLALDLDGHVLVLLQAVGQVGFLGRLGRLGGGEGLYLADRIRLLDRDRLVGLQFLKIKLLDEVGYVADCM